MIEALLFWIFLLILLFVFLLPILIPVSIVTIVAKAIYNNKFKKNNINYENLGNVNEDAIKNTGLNKEDINKLKDNLFLIFYKFENAYNNLDYNTMYNLCTPKLYNMYYNDIAIKLQYENKRFISDIKLNDMKIYSIGEYKDEQTVRTLISISYKNYIQSLDGKIIGGNDQIKKESFEVQFVKNLKKDNKYKCPNCGATVNGSSCDYCKTRVKYDEFKISTIRRIIYNSNKER